MPPTARPAPCSGTRSPRRRSPGSSSAGPASPWPSSWKGSGKSSSTWRTSSTSGWWARTRRYAWSPRPSSAAGRASPTPTSPSAPSSSWGPPAWARPSWPKPWPRPCLTPSATWCGSTCRSTWRNSPSPGSSERPPATWAMRRGDSSPRRCGANPTPWSSLTRWRRPTPTCSTSSSRSWTTVGSPTARGGRWTLRTPSSSSPPTWGPSTCWRASTHRGRSPTRPNSRWTSC